MYEIIQKAVDDIMQLRKYGTCSWCGRHTYNLHVHSWELNGNLYTGWLCEKCLEGVRDEWNFSVIYTRKERSK